MNTMVDSSGELRSKTYLKALLFLLPGLAVWVAISKKCVPIFVILVANTGFESANAVQAWNFSMFLARNSLYILPLFAGVFLLMELLGGNWSKYRRQVVGMSVWTVNSAILLGLASFFTLCMIAFPNLR